ncbi:MAG: hypothetical protein AAFX54_16080 [Pseudomonadota bacterium]
MKSDQKISDWQFGSEEISAGVYRVYAIHKLGNRAERQGISPDDLRNEVKADALKIQQQLDQLIANSENRKG